MKLDLWNYLEDQDMGIYKNDYSKNEDETLWELHEIRNKLYKELKSKPIAQINEEALGKYKTWIKEKDNLTNNPSIIQQDETNKQPTTKGLPSTRSSIRN